jgi:hypothetical protein
MALSRTVRGWIGAVAVVAAAAVVWVQVIRPNVVPKNFGVVDEGRVYRSGQLTPAAMRRVVERHHIRTVIDLGSYWAGERLADARGDRRNQQMTEAMDTTRYVLPLFGDGTGNLNYYVQALRLMNDPRNQPVLVHCGAGSERTGLAAILYSRLRGGATDTAAAIEEAKRFHHNPAKNPGVRAILEKWGPEIVRCAREGGSVAGFDPVPAPRPVVGADGEAESAGRAAAPGSR